MHISLHGNTVHNRHRARRQRAILADDHVDVFGGRDIIQHIQKLQILDIPPALQTRLFVPGVVFVVVGGLLCVAAATLALGFWLCRFGSKARVERIVANDELVGRRNLVEHDGVEGHTVGELEALAAHDDGDIAGVRQHCDGGGADAGVEAAVGHHGVGAQEHEIGVFEGVRGGAVQHVSRGDAGGGERAGQVAALEERARVEYHDGELGAPFVGAEEGLLDDRRLGEGDDGAAVADLCACGRGDCRVGDGDAFADEEVDGGADVFFGFGLGRVGVDVDDEVFEPADCVAHGDGDWAVGF